MYSTAARRTLETTARRSIRAFMTSICSQNLGTRHSDCAAAGMGAARNHSRHRSFPHRMDVYLTSAHTQVPQSVLAPALRLPDDLRTEREAGR